MKCLVQNIFTFLPENANRTKATLPFMFSFSRVLVKLAALLTASPVPSTGQLVRYSHVVY